MTDLDVTATDEELLDEIDDDYIDEGAWQEMKEAVRAEALRMAANGPVLLEDLTSRVQELNLVPAIEEWVTARASDTSEIATNIRNNVHDLVSDSNALWITKGENGSVASTAAALDGVVLTHRVTAKEIEDGVLLADPDLSFIDYDCSRGESLAFDGGGEFQWDSSDWMARGEPGGSYVGPQGWLSEYSPGDLLAISRTGGTIKVERIDDFESSGEVEASALRAAFETKVPPKGSEEMMYVGMEALATNSLLFRQTTPPITELLVNAGLEHDSPEVGRVGEQWQKRGSLFANIHRGLVAEKFDLEGCCRVAFEEAVEAYETNKAFNPAHTLESLVHSDVLEAFVDYVFSRSLFASPHDITIGRTKAFAETLFMAARREDKERACALALRAEVHDRNDECVEAEALFREASLIEPLPLALAGLARYAADRGDAVKARSLLRQTEGSGAPKGEKQQLPLLDALLSPFDGAGRNDKCPCGSGRKYKTCCSMTPRISVDDRQRWLFHRVFSFTLQSHQASLTKLIMQTFGFDIPRELEETYNVRFFLATLLIFDGGGLEKYANARGHLLDDMDRECIEQWRTTPFTLWEVVETVPLTTLRSINSIVASPLDPAANLRNMGRSPSELKQAFETGDFVIGRFSDRGKGLNPLGAVILVHPHAVESARELVASNPDIDAIATWYRDALIEEPSTVDA